MTDDHRATNSALTALVGAARFFAVAGANFAIGLILIYGLLFLGLSPVAANLIGYAIAIPYSFYTHARISFRQTSIRWSDMARYVLAILTSYLANLAVLIAVTRFFELNGYWAQIPAMATYAVVFYLLSRRFVFNRRGVSQ